MTIYMCLIGGEGICSDGKSYNFEKRRYTQILEYMPLFLSKVGHETTEPRFHVGFNSHLLLIFYDVSRCLHLV